MFKKILVALIFTISCGVSYGQSKVADSLRSELTTVVDPIDRFDILNRLILDLTGWKGDNIDSVYSEQMFQIAQQLNNDSLLAISYNWLGKSKRAFEYNR